MTQHLNELDVRLYQKRALSAADLLRASDHFSTCELCRNRVAPAEADAAAANIRKSLASVDSPYHLTYQELSDYVDGSLKRVAMEMAESHLRGCEECAVEISDMRAVKDEIDLREAKATAMPAAKHPARQWAWVAAAAAFVLSLGGLVWRQSAIANAPEFLLASAYTTARPFEFRLPDKGYGPIRQQRPGESSALDRSPSLMLAETKIQEKMKNSGERAELYLLRGRAELLERQYDSAIESLTRANELGADAPPALADLGCAYALRGDAEHRPIDYGHAIELLRQSLKAKAQQPIVLFNLALVYERVALVDEAAETWKQFLAVDTSSGWTKEAAGHLEQVEARQKKREQARRQITPDAGAFLALTRAQPDGINAELFQEIAWREWLPQGKANVAAHQAVLKLAEIFVERYHDSSLQDAWRPAGASGDTIPLQTLAAAMKKNAAGQYDEAYPLGEVAAKSLLQAGNRAASFRARLEVAISRQRLSPAACLAAAAPLVKELETMSYPWMLGQALLQESICYTTAGELEQASRDCLRASEILGAAHLAILQLRAQAGLGAIVRETGNFAAVWEITDTGLQRCWQFSAPPARAQQFDFDLAEASKGLEWHQTASVFAAAAVREIARTGLKPVEAVTRVYTAAFLQAAGDESGASTELANAEAILQTQSASPTNKGLLLDARLTRAEMSPPQLSAGRAALIQLEPELVHGPHVAWEELVRVKQALGLSLSAAGDDNSALKKFEEGIAECRRGLHSTTDSMARLAGTEMAAPAYKGVMSIQLDKKHDPSAALATWDAYRRSPLSDDSLLAAQPMTSESARLTYVSLPEGIAAFVQDSHFIGGRMLTVSPREIQIVQRRFLRSCAHPGSDSASMQSDARQLYRWLIEPFLPRLEKTHTLVIDADGWLAGVAFPALIGEAGHFLIEDFSITMFQPLTANPNRQEERISHTAGALIVSVASPGGQIPPLTFANEEASQVAGQFKSAQVLTGGVSIDSMKAAAPSARVFHFVGHGWSNAGDGGLILSSTGGAPAPSYLTANALARMDWSACSLVVLSACMTGTGEDRGPFNPRSLVRAFLASGARRVVAARWNLDEAASATLMHRFYSSLIDSTAPAQSLALAQRAMIRQSEYRHPYYWAAFTIYGEL